MALPQGQEDLTAEWLSAALGRDVTIAGIEQIGIGVGLLGRLFRLRLSDDTSVIAKLPTLDEAARMNVIEPLRFYSKEVSFYREAAHETPVGTPEAYAAEYDAESGDFVLLLEDLSSRRIPDQTLGCNQADAHTAVDAMTDLHAYWWDSPRFPQMPWLADYTEPPYPQIVAGMFKQAWPVAQEILGPELPGEYRDYGDRFADLVPWFLETLGAKEPRTFCHGDFRLDNLFFAAGPDDPPVTIIDWQICFRGRGGYDLGYFLSQSLSTGDRRECENALIDRYHERLTSAGIDYPRNELDDDYRATVAYCFCYPVISAGQVEITNERHRQLIAGMMAGATAAIEDNNALALLP